MKNSKKVDIILLCGGEGTRFHEVTKDVIPKSLFRIKKLELINYSLQNLDYKLVNTLIFAVHHHAEFIKNWVATLNLPCNVLFSDQTKPGIFGAVNRALELVQENLYVICNTDEIREGLTLSYLLDKHLESPHKLASMPCAYTSNLYRHRTIKMDYQNAILDTQLKNELYKYHLTKKGWVNTGFILFDKRATRYFDNSLGNGWDAIINPLVNARQIKGVPIKTMRYFNIGTSEELLEAVRFLNQPKAKLPSILGK